MCRPTSRAATLDWAWLRICPDAQRRNKVRCTEACCRSRRHCSVCRSSSVRALHEPRRPSAHVPNPTKPLSALPAGGNGLSSTLRKRHWLSNRCSMTLREHRRPSLLQWRRPDMPILWYGGALQGPNPQKIWPPKFRDLRRDPSPCDSAPPGAPSHGHKILHSRPSPLLDRDLGLGITAAPAEATPAATPTASATWGTMPAKGRGWALRGAFLPRAKPSLAHLQWARQRCSWQSTTPGVPPSSKATPGQAPPFHFT
jgi:hypothetical protein